LHFGVIFGRRQDTSGKQKGAAQAGGDVQLSAQAVFDWWKKTHTHTHNRLMAVDPALPG